MALKILVTKLQSGYIKLSTLNNGHALIGVQFCNGRACGIKKHGQMFAIGAGRGFAGAGI